MYCHGFIVVMVIAGVNGKFIYACTIRERRVCSSLQSEVDNKSAVLLRV